MTDAPPPRPPDEHGDRLDGLDRWVADAKVDQAVAERRRTAWLRRQADEDATFVGVLRELGERGRPVVVQTLTGRRHQGIVTLVGDDVIGLETMTGTSVIAALRAVISVRAQGEGTPVTDPQIGNAGELSGATLASSLARRAGERTPVVVTAPNGESTSGELVAVGRDLLTLRVEGGGLAYVSLASVVEVTLFESG